MYCNISSIKAAYFNTNLVNPDFRVFLRPFFNIESLIKKSLISYVYMYKTHTFLTKKQFEEIYNQISIETGINLNLDDIDPLIEHIDDKDIKYVEAEDYSLLKSIIKKEKRSVESKKTTFKSLAKSVIPFSISDKKIVSVDFEFRQLGSIFYTLEMGITTLKDGVLNSFHYVVEERKNRTTFVFGDTILVNPEDFNGLLEEHLKDANYIIGHNFESEYNLLKATQFDFNILNNIEVIDTSYSLNSEFIVKDVQSKFSGKQVSLKNALNLFGIAFTSLHNAGNDSFYALKLLTSLVEHKVEAHRIAPERKKRIIIRAKTPFV